MRVASEVVANHAHWFSFTLLFLSACACAASVVASDCEQGSYDDSLVLLQMEAGVRRAITRPDNASTLSNVAELPAVHAHREHIGALQVSAVANTETGSQSNATFTERLVHRVRAGGQEDSQIIMLGAGVAFIFYCFILSAFYTSNSEKSGPSLCLTPAQLVQPPARLPPGAGMVLSGKFMQPTRDYPLSIPLASLKTSEWSIDITGATGAQLLSACLTSYRDIRRVQLFDNNKDKETPVGQVDSSLLVLDPAGVAVGRIHVTDSPGNFSYSEPGGNSPWMTIETQANGEIDVFSGQGQRRVLATLTRVRSTQGECLQVSAIAGTDALLVTLLYLGIMAFKRPPKW